MLVSKGTVKVFAAFIVGIVVTNMYQSVFDASPTSRMVIVPHWKKSNADAVPLRVISDCPQPTACHCQECPVCAPSSSPSSSSVGGVSGTTPPATTPSMPSRVLQKTKRPVELQYANFCEHHTRQSTSRDDERWRKHATKNGPVPAHVNTFPQSCDADFARKQVEFYKREFFEPHIPQVGPLYCFDAADMLPHWQKVDPNPNKVILDIGANKGFYSAQIYEVFSNFTTNFVWKLNGLHPGCPWYADIDKHVYPRVYAFEPGLGSFAALQRMQQTLPMCNFQPFHAAMSDKVGETKVQATAAGDEQLRLGSGSITIPLMTVDSFAQQHNIKHIDMISIDTETHDPFVLKGMQKLVSQQRIDMICFEMNDGKISQHLKGIIDNFDEHKYDCFITGPALLLKITGPSYLCFLFVFVLLTFGE